MKLRIKIKIALSLSCLIVGQLLSAITFPGAVPGSAQLSTNGNIRVLENDYIKATWTLSDGASSFDSVDNVLGDIITSVASPLFVITLQDSTILNSNSMTLLEQSTPSSVENGGSQSVYAKFSDVATDAVVEWTATLRNESNYIRQVVVITPTTPLAVSTIKLLDFQTDNAETTGTVDGSPITTNSMFMGFESPLTKTTAVDNGGSFDIDGLWDLPVTLAAGEAESFSTVIGVYPDGQLRRAFLYYIERERARPYKQFLHYNTWFDLNIDSPLYHMTETDALASVTMIGDELVTNRGVTMESFVMDDGWDSHDDVWTFHDDFPNGFQNIYTKTQTSYNAGVGVWMSPWGGYEAAKAARIASGTQPPYNYETNNSGFSMAGTNYGTHFKNTCFDMMDNHGVNYFKFDGMGGGNYASGADAEYAQDVLAILNLTKDLRARNSDVYINATVGTWPSPFWTHYADSIWRQGADHGLLGVGNNREQWITYRDKYTYDFAQRGALYPLNSLMFHGVVISSSASTGSMPLDATSIRNEIRMGFGGGSQLQELYLTPTLLTSENWDDLAESAKWSRRNSDILADTHWVGGNPNSLEVYGFASWTPEKAIITLRNPSDESQIYSLNIEDAFELPAGFAQNFEFNSPYSDQRIQTFNGSSTAINLTLEPFEVLVFDATATELYLDALSGTVSLPSGIYGAITTPDEFFGSTLASDIILEDLAVLDTSIAFVDHTIAFWFKPSDNISGAENIDIYTVDSKPGVVDSYDQYDLRQTTANTLELWFENGNSTIETSALTPDTWYHIAVTIDADHTVSPKSGTGLIYINGALATASTENQFNVQVNGSQTAVDSEIRFFSGLTLAGIYVDNIVLDATTVQSKALYSINPPVDAIAVADSFVFAVGTVAGNVMTNDENIVVADTEAHLVSTPANNSGTFSLATDGSFTYTTISFALPDSFTYELRSTEGAVYNTVTVKLTPSGMAAYWSMDETTGTTVTDSVNSIVGTMTGGVTFNTIDQRIGTSALTFNGTQSTKVDCGTAALVSGSTNFTLAAYIKTTSTGDDPIVSQMVLGDLSGYDGQMMFSIKGGKLFFQLYDENVVAHELSSTGSVNDGNWHHVAVVREGASLKFYIDGIEDTNSATTGFGGLLNTNNRSMGIGCNIRDWNNQWFSTFTGSIDEVGIIHKALTVAEVNSIIPEPVAVTDSFSLTSGSVTENVMLNDVDLISSNTEAYLVSSPTNHTGLFTLATDGSFTYVTDLDSSLAMTDSFTYELRSVVGTVYNVVTVTLSQAGLFAHFKMDETTGTAFVDKLGNLTGSYEGTVTLAETGPNEFSGTAVSFDGNVANYATTSSNTVLGGSEFSVSFWAKGDPSGSHEAVVSSRSGENGWIMYYNANQIQFWIKSSTGDAWTWNAGVNTDTNWHHYVGTFDGDTLNLYVDGGAQTYTESGVDYTPSPGQTINIGRNPQGNLPFSGTVDDVKYFNKAITSADVLALYTDTLTPTIGIEVVQTGTELTWTIEEEVGVKQYNITVNGVTTVVMFDAEANGSYSIILASDAPATITVVDFSGFKQSFLPSDGNIVKVVYDLQEGWNLIAMPGENADTTDIDSVFWGWDGSAYELIETPIVGNAVWVYSPSQKQVIVSAEKVESLLKVVSGWNLVGPTVNIAVPIEAYKVYGWNNTYQEIANDGVLLQGVGYWIFSL